MMRMSRCERCPALVAHDGRWVTGKVDFSENRNLVTAAVALTLGAGDLTLSAGDFSLGGIGTATFAAIIVYQLLRIGTPVPELAGGGA